MKDNCVSLLTGSSSILLFLNDDLFMDKEVINIEGKSHKLPELRLTGKLGKAKVSGDQNCVNGSHFFLGLIYEKLYILACYFKE